MPLASGTRLGSNARSGGPFVLPVFINGILIHALGVGLPSALFAARVPARRAAR